MILNLYPLTDLKFIIETKTNSKNKQFERTSSHCTSNKMLIWLNKREKFQ